MAVEPLLEVPTFLTAAGLGVAAARIRARAPRLTGADSAASYWFLAWLAAMAVSLIVAHIVVALFTPPMPLRFDPLYSLAVLANVVLATPLFALTAGVTSAIARHR